MFLRMANPAFVLEKTGKYWSRFHDHGRWTTTRLPNGAMALLEDFEGSATYCAMLVPYTGRLFELVGAKGVRVAHPECRSKGARACRFEISWR